MDSGRVVTAAAAGPVVVIGATGQQGGAALTALLDAGVPVRAAVRDIAAPKALDAAHRGADVVVADLGSVESLQRLFDGASAAFAMTTFSGPAGIEGEVEHGRTLAEAASKADLPFMVYSSVGGVERGSGVPHFESKYRIEKFLVDATPVAFVRPTFFMENLLSMVQRTEEAAVLSMPLPKDIALQMVSVRTIGSVVAAFLIRHPAPGSAVEIASDELTGEQMAAKIAERFNIATEYQEIPLSALADDADQSAMWQWFTRLPAYQADFTRTQELSGYDDDLSTWLARQQLD
ncbi:MAG: NmrA family NAD(P)-binding protein [Mycobacterium sp.]